jgi:hypothetical protein
VTPKRAKYIREERNGKVVYIPASEQDATVPDIRPLRSNRTWALGEWAIKALGWSFNLWFPPIAWIGASTLTVGVGWFAWQAITNPDVVFWVNQFTPGNLNRKIPADDQPKTFPEILAQLERHDKKAGTPIALTLGLNFQGGIEGANLIALPILGEREDAACAQRCEFIQELQIYRTLDLPPLMQLLQRRPRFRSVNRMQLLGPSDQDLNRLIRTVKGSGSGEGSPLPLGMSQLEQKTLENDLNTWLILSGFRAKGNATAAYGQILHFSPGRSQLSVMLNWLSPSGQFPEWEDVTGDGQPDIVIDQSIELEPSFAAFEIKRSPNGAIWVTPVDLTRPAIKTSEYQSALQLARSGLWLQSQQRLMAIQDLNGTQWTAAAQAQLGLIQRHAHFLQSRANSAFSDPIEEIQTLLVQGSWESAQRKLYKSREMIQAIQRILAADNGQIGDRIQASAQLGSPPKAVIEWGIIYAYSQGGKAQAVKWINANHPASAALIDPLIKKLTQSSPPSASKTVKSSGSASTGSNPQTSQVKPEKP